MKRGDALGLSYFDLLSPKPYFLEGVGHIKSVTLKEIGEIGYEQFSVLTALLQMNIDRFLENPAILFSLVTSLNFFIWETVVYNSSQNEFHCLDQNERIVGRINRDNYSAVTDVILQRHSMGRKRDPPDASKVKNKLAKKIYDKLADGQKNQILNKSQKELEDYEIPNLISVLSVVHHSLNMTNIWDLTVYQLYDQFQRQQLYLLFLNQSRSISVWGDKNNKFNFNQWFQKIKQ